ncbi:MAG TPA: FAD-binding oxidoreductase, partial [Woeseiaceae bacterium]|nr:FAD-binding oxidoreductase [Woeseiaceae bacterium]
MRRETTIPDESSRDRIAREIAGRISGEVRFDTAARAMYATDASNYRQVPVGVVLPRCAEDIMAAVDSCSRHGLPLTMRGGGTSVAGQTCNNAVVLDASKYYNRVLEIDPDSRTALVEPG